MKKNTLTRICSLFPVRSRKTPEYVDRKVNKKTVYEEKGIYQYIITS